MMEKSDNVFQLGCNKRGTFFGRTVLQKRQGTVHRTKKEGDEINPLFQSKRPAKIQMVE